MYDQGLGVAQTPDPSQFATAATPLADLKLKAAAGDMDAVFELAYVYEHGKGTRKDERQAAEYYRAAAEKGDSTAANNLAVMYEQGRGVKKDLRQAVAWYQEAAIHGDPTAQCNLAYLYFSGKGVIATTNNLPSGIGPPRSNAYLSLSTISRTCIIAVSVSRSTTPRPYGGPEARPRPEMHWPKPILDFFMSKAKASRWITH
jgi:TPR repeat protein